MAATRSLPPHYHPHSVAGVASATVLTSETTPSISQLASNQIKLPLPPRKRRQSSSDFNTPFSNNENNATGFPTNTGSAATDGCGVLKAFISNILTFATRSRRKVDINNKERGGAIVNQTLGPNNAGQTPLAQLADNTNFSAKKSGATTAGVSFSQAGSAKLVRKSTIGGMLETQLSTDTTTITTTTCVADSIDDELLEQVFRLPPRICKNEWLATQTLALFDHINALCGTMTDLCTPVTCPIMSYPGVTKANWVDDKGKRHHYSAMRYIDSVMAFCESARQNQNYFPTKFGCVFGADFEPICNRMIRLMWYCCGHLYIKHWEQLTILNVHLQFSLVLAHLSKIVKLYSILDTKENTALQTTLQIIRPIKSIPHKSLSPKTILSTNNNNNNSPALIQRPSKKRSNADVVNELQRLQKQANTTGGRWPAKCHPQPTTESPIDSQQGTQHRSTARSSTFSGKCSSWGGAINRRNEVIPFGDNNNAKENVAIALTVADLLNGSTGNCKCYAQTC